MRKNYSYRLFPTKPQRRRLDRQLEECRWLYNHFLLGRKEAYQASKTTVRLYDQQKEIPLLKEKRPTLKGVFSQILQNVTVRLDLAFQAFFRRVKAGEKPGYPRFKGVGRYNSVTYTQVPSGCELREGKLRLSKIGSVKIVLHRQLEGKPKTCTIKRSSTGKWYACFSCELSDPKPLPKSETKIGIDVGLYSFATLSNGEKIDNPRFFRKDERELAKAQRQMTNGEKGSPTREKKRRVVSRIHERIAFRRRDFAHQCSRKLVNRFGTIVVENLEINRMVRNKCLAKSISDAAWSLFFSLLVCKAEWAGRLIVKVDPAYTSQTCNACGYRRKLLLDDRVFYCPECKREQDRDLNAALNILDLGLGRQSLG